MTIKKTGSAHWVGNIKEGKGTVSTQSGALKDQPYGFNTRFESQPGTNPEELLGAAHASCFAMALSLILGEAGFTPSSLKTESTISLEKDGEGFSVTKAHLTLRGIVPNATEAQFLEAAKKAEAGCPLSKVLKAEILLDAKLEN